jgi:hypothetical protein
MSTTLNLAARAAVATLVAAGLALGTHAHADTGVRLAAASSMLAVSDDARSLSSDPSRKDVQDAAVAAAAARDAAKAAAQATGTARSVLDTKRAERAQAFRDATTAQNDVATRQAAFDAAEKASVAAAEAKKRAAVATNAEPNNAVLEAEYNIRNQDWIKTLGPMFDAGKRLDAAKKARGDATEACVVKNQEVPRAEADLARAQANQAAAEKAARDADRKYNDLLKKYDNRH